MHARERRWPADFEINVNSRRPVMRVVIRLEDELMHIHSKLLGNSGFSLVVKAQMRGQSINDDNETKWDSEQNPDFKPGEHPETQEETQMYGIIGKMNATEGNRDKLIEILLHGTKEMPGCKLYAISTDSTDDNGIWMTEIWDSEESHQASLQLPGVQKAIADGKPMIAGFGDRHIVTPIGGVGIN